MHLIRSSVAVAVVCMAAGCGRRGMTDTTGVQPPPIGLGQGAHIVVSPASSTILLGDSVQLHASVEGLGTGNQGVRWSTSSTAFTVSNTGLVVAKCYPGGTATVVATSLADTTVAGAGTVIADPLALPAASISGVYQAGTGEPAALDRVTDSINVVATLAPSVVPCYALTEADLVVHRAAGDTVVARLPLDTLATKPFSVGLMFRSDAKVNGVPVFPNGDYAVRIDALTSGQLPSQQSSTINLTVHN